MVSNNGSLSYGKFHEWARWGYLAHLRLITAVCVEWCSLCYVINASLTELDQLSREMNGKETMHKLFLSSDPLPVEFYQLKTHGKLGWQMAGCQCFVVSCVV